MNKYPEHDKLQNISEQSQFIGEFLDWLRSTNRCIGVMAFDSFGDPVIRDDTTSVQNLLAEFYQIDLRKIEAEKQQMLDEIRQSANA